MLGCWLAARKWPVAIELIHPILGVAVCLFCLPTWYENPKRLHVIKGLTLTQLQSFIYVLNFVSGAFCTSNYKLSVAGRSMLALNNLNLAIRTIFTGQNEALAALLTVVMAVTAVETNFYFYNLEKVKLFLTKEEIHRRERQTHEILQNMPTNVMVVTGT